MRDNLVFVFVLGINVCLWSSCVQSEEFVFRPELSISGNYENGEPYPYIDVQKNSNLEIRCTAKEPIEWLYPSKFPINIEIKNSGALINENKFVSTVTLTQLRADNTGRYSCYHAADNTSESSIYIYVNDPSQLLVSIPILQAFQFVSSSEAAKLPCFVTKSSASMILRNEVDNRVYTFGQSITYSKQLGVTLHYPTQELSGGKQCIARLDGQESVQNIRLFYKRQTKPPAPEITSERQEYSIMENITLTCSVNIDRSSTIDLVWSAIPNDDGSGRIRRGRAMKRTIESNGIVYNKVTSKLTILNAQEKDGGMYDCTVQTRGQSSVKTHAVKIFNSTWVHLKSAYQVESFNETTEEAFFEIQYESYPDPEFFWFKDGAPLLIDSNKFHSRTDRRRIHFTIMFPQKEDAGEYVLTATTKNMNESITLHLEYDEPPVVTLNTPPSNPYYTVGLEYTLTCLVSKGSPTPVISWFWQPCLVTDNFEGCKIGMRWISPSSFTFTNQRRTVKFQPRESGYVQCIGRNRNGRSNDMTQILVTDIPQTQGFYFDNIRITLTEGDSLSFRCMANRWSYQSPQIFRVFDDYDLAVNESYITSYHTAYTNVVVVTFNYSLPSQSGSYKCIARTQEGTIKQEIKEIAVLALVAPVLTVKPKSKDCREDQSVVLRCNATGHPEPNIVWLKDQEVIKRNRPGFKFSPDFTVLTIERVKVNDSGVYVCQASNKGGTIRFNATLGVRAKPQRVIEKPLSAGAIGGIVAGAVLLVGVFILVICVLYIKMKRSRKHPASALLLPSKDEINPDIPLDEQTDGLAYDDSWEFPRDRLKLGMILGQGAFGKVVKAQAVGIEDGVASSTVAVKTVRDSYDLEQIKALISELKILIHIGQHLNIMNLLGAVTKDLSKGELYVIVEYCPHGNLRSYLLKHKGHFVDTMGKPGDDPVAMKKIEAEAANADDGYLNDAGLSDPHNERNPLTTRDLVCWSFQIARGMEYLESRKYIHRDLAARNVLLASDNVVKICDFGLAKDVYKYNEYQKKTDGPLPIKWMALESLTHKVFTSKTDVWAYGVFLWELFSMAQSPYPGVELNETFIEKLKNGYRMARPEHAAADMYQLMLDCWASEPSARPSFSDIAERTGDLIQESLVERYICLNELYGKRSKSTASEGNGYLRMNSQGYLAMQPAQAMASESAAAVDEVSIHSGSSEADDRYANKLKKKSGKKENGDDFEMQPMIEKSNVQPQSSIKKDPVDLSDMKVDFTDGTAVTTAAVVHRPPGHALPSVNMLNPRRPRDDDDVFLPSIRQNERHSSGSATSSGFLSDYWNEDSVPPHYNVAVRKEGLLETDI